MRLILVLALLAGLAGCAAETKAPMALRANGGCYLGNGQYSGARCPGEHP